MDNFVPKNRIEHIESTTKCSDRSEELFAKRITLLPYYYGILKRFSIISFKNKQRKEVNSGNISYGLY